MKKLAIVFVAVLALTGCRTSQTELREALNIRDSVRIKDSVRITDSLRMVTNIKDSLRIKDSTVVVVDEQGNVKSKETWHEKEHIREQKDSTQIYKAMLREALSQRDQALKEQKMEKVVIEKPRSFIEKAKEWLAGALIGVVVGVVLMMSLSLRQNRKAQ